jgi:hypothetical protein
MKVFKKKFIAHPKRVRGAIVVSVLAIGIVFLIAHLLNAGGTWVSNQHLPWMIISLVVCGVALVSFSIWLYGKLNKSSSKARPTEKEKLAPPSPKVVYKATKGPRRVVLSRLAFGSLLVAIGVLFALALFDSGNVTSKIGGFPGSARLASYNNVSKHFEGNPRDRFHGTDRDSIIAYLSKYPHDSLLIEIIGCETGYQQFADLERKIVLRNAKYPFVVGAAQLNEQANADVIAMSGQNVEQLTGNLEVAHVMFEEHGPTPWESSATCWRDHNSGGGVVSDKTRAEVVSNRERSEAVDMLSGKIDTVIRTTTTDGKWTDSIPLYGRSARWVSQAGMDLEVCVELVCKDGETFKLSDDEIVAGLGMHVQLKEHRDVLHFRSRVHPGTVMVIVGS